MLFLPKSADFLQKNADISETKRALLLKGVFSETTYVVYLYTKFQVASIIFRPGRNLPPPPPPPPVPSQRDSYKAHPD